MVRIFENGSDLKNGSVICKWFRFDFKAQNYAETCVQSPIGLSLVTERRGSIKDIAKANDGGDYAHGLRGL